MIPSAYVDSSVILALLLREISPEIQLDGKQPVTSELSDLECRRTLDRIRIQEQLSNEAISDYLTELEEMMHAFRLIQFGRPIFKRAKAPFPTVVRSLDAIHLATAELVHASTFITMDKQQSSAARAVGLKTLVLESLR